VSQARRVEVRTDSGAIPVGAPCAEVRLDLLGRPFHARLPASPFSARLPDLVPTAIRLSSALIEAAMGQLALRGALPSCRKGCRACCRFLVPVSGAEAMWMWERMATLPDPARTRLLGAHAEAGRRLLQALPPAATGDGARDIREISRWYERLGLDCPFLEGGACAVYSGRPLACREFFAYCAPGPGGRSQAGSAIRLPVSVASALAEMTAEFEPRWPRAVLLPLALAWAADASRRPRPRRWPGRLLALRLADILRRQAAEHEGAIRAA
jgi:Fe-S-cluster containining protein